MVTKGTPPVKGLPTWGALSTNRSSLLVALMMSRVSPRNSLSYPFSKNLVVRTSAWVRNSHGSEKFLLSLKYYILLLYRNWSESWTMVATIHRNKWVPVCPFKKGWCDRFVISNHNLEIQKMYLGLTCLIFKMYTSLVGIEGHHEFLQIKMLAIP